MSFTADLSFRPLLISKKIIFSFISIFIVLIVPILSHQQLITGTVVNACLLITVVLLGQIESTLIGFLPSLVALSSGLLPLALAPAISYIMVGNALYIYFFSKIYKHHLLTALLVAAGVKFTFLVFSSEVILHRLLQPAQLSRVITMLSWPQLITSISGGILAIIVLRLKQKHS